MRSHARDFWPFQPFLRMAITKTETFWTFVFAITKVVDKNISFSVLKMEDKNQLPFDDLVDDLLPWIRVRMRLALKLLAFLLTSLWYFKLEKFNHSLSDSPVNRIFKISALLWYLTLLGPSYFGPFKTRKGGKICPQAFSFTPELLEGVTYSKMGSSLSSRKNLQLKTHFWCLGHLVPEI